ncbi:MAG: SDR family oxidoreductase [Euryarchaeota archaeon]|jgi:NAD(P)-dependent dehydrogenase (short-subunit alcohol dehydrogenase family)|nr:SDR family oxidoreductase [Euryarchaeota archaeon]
MGVALVTGGSRRIGAEICRTLAQSGHSVIIHYYNSEDSAKSLAEELNKISKAATIKANLDNTHEVQLLFENASKIFGQINILINNASLFEYDTIGSLDCNLFNQSIAINTLAPLILCEELSKQPNLVDGCIVNILDNKLQNPNPDYLSYTTSKVALGGLIESLAIGLAPSTRVNGIAPGLILPSPHASISDFEEVHDSTPLERGATAQDIADAVVFLVNAKGVTGQVIFVDGGERFNRRDRDVLYERGE